MSKKGKLKGYVSIKGIGNKCPKCFKPMQRRQRIKPPVDKSYYYTEWDYCEPCGHVQHYEEFKSTEWKAVEEHDNLFTHAIS